MRFVFCLLISTHKRTKNFGVSLGSIEGIVMFHIETNIFIASKETEHKITGSAPEFK